MKKKIGIFEEVEIDGFNGQKSKIQAKVDTGAYRTSIDIKLAKKLNLLDESNILEDKRRVKSALGVKHRKVIHIKFVLGGIELETDASIADRSNLKFDMIIGRKDLGKFIIEYDPKTEVRV